MIKTVSTIFLAITISLSFSPKLYAQSKNLSSNYHEGVIVEIKNIEQKNGKVIQLLQKITLKGLSTDVAGKKFTSQTLLPQNEDNRYKKNERVIFSYDPSSPTNQVLILDVVRRTPLYALFLIFLSIVFLVGKKRGISSFIGLLFSFLVIMKFVIPGIVEGSDPIIISLLAALLVIPTTFILSHGFERKTFVAIIGTLIALCLTGFLSYFFVVAARITGFALEDAVFVQSLVSSTINIRSLLLAGIIIGAMGILDDITISQTSVVDALYKTNSKLSKRDLYFQAMDVGKDHIASLVNTLVLVYAGASLPLFILFTNSQLPLSLVINNEIIATEIIRTLVSSIGIILAVPITTFLATHAVKRK